MPAFDLPLDELRTYTGRNPRPADHDAYWAEAVTELDHVEADVRIDPVPHVASYAKCSDLWFTGVRGARVYAKLLRPTPRDATPHPAVVVFHGYSAHSPEWFELLPYVAQGFTVAALDVRGQGGRSQDVGGALGSTLEGHIVRGLDDDPRNLACAALEPRVRAAAPVFPFLSDFLRVWEMDLATEAYAELRSYLRRFDPTHARVGEMFTRLGYIDVQHLTPRIGASVLMQTGLMDTVCPPSTQFAAYNRIRSRKEMVLYPDFEHEKLPGGDDRVLEFLVRELAAP